MAVFINYSPISLMVAWFLYRGGNKGLHVLLSRTQAGPGRTVKQEQDEISRNHVQTFICLSVPGAAAECPTGNGELAALAGMAHSAHYSFCCGHPAAASGSDVAANGRRGAAASPSSSSF